MGRLTTDQIKQFSNTTFGREVGKHISRQVVAELLFYRQLSEKIGCPLEVRCSVNTNDYIYGKKGETYQIKAIYEKFLVATYRGSAKLIPFDWKEYKVTWWLKADKSE